MAAHRFGLVIALAGSMPAVAACKKSTGTCELTYEESSPDGSIPAGLAACMPNFTKERCDPGKLRDVTLGLKTRGFTFNKGASCSELGYQDCSGGRGVIFYLSCPGSDEAVPAREPNPNRNPATTLGAPLAVPDDAPFEGKADGQLVLHVFTDFQDPYSKRLLPTLDELLEDHAELKLVFRHRPLPFHRAAPLAHQAAIEAYAQKGNDGFWAMSDLLFANQRKLGRSDLAGYAKKVGLDVAAFDEALDAGTHHARMQQDMKVADAKGLRGIPVLVVGTTILRGPLSESSIGKALADAQ